MVDVTVNPSLPTQLAEGVIASAPGVVRYTRESLLIASASAGDGAPRTRADVDSDPVQVRASSNGRSTATDRPVVHEGRMIERGAEAFVVPSTLGEGARLSPRRQCRQTKGPSCIGHPLVVGDHSREVLARRRRSCQVDGVEATDGDGFDPPRGEEEISVDYQQTYGTGTHEGKTYDRWQYEATAGVRIFDFVDDPTSGGRKKPQRQGRGLKPCHRVIIEATHPGHPKATERKRG